MNTDNQNKQRQIWLGVLVSAICLVAIFFFIKPQEMFDALKTAHYGYLIFTVLGIVLFLVLRAVRWRFMLNNDAPYTQVLHIQNIGYMLTMMLPLRIGDVARAILIGNVPPVTLSRGISTMVVERIMDMIFMVTILPFTLAEVGTLPTQFQEVARLFGFAAIGGILVLIAAANQRPFVRRIVRRIAVIAQKLVLGSAKHRTGRRGLVKYVATHEHLLEPETWVRHVDDMLAGLDSLTRLKDGLILIFLSILVWLPIIFAYHITLLAVNIHPTLPMTLLTIAAAAFSVAAPSSPGQIGVFHAGVTFALVEILGQPGPEAASFAVLYHALNTLTLILLGFIGLVGANVTFNNVVTTTRSFMQRRDAGGH